MNVTRRSLGRSESDEQRFERLYEQHFERVTAYLLARTDRDSAAEAVARTFEIAWRRLPDVPVEPLPWLLGVARRVLADQWRAQGRRNALVEHIAEAPRETSDDHAETLAARELVLAAIKDLTPFQQEALLLIAWDGLSEREAAAVLGCSRGAVALRLPAPASSSVPRWIAPPPSRTSSAMHQATPRRADQSTLRKGDHMSHNLVELVRGLRPEDAGRVDELFPQRSGSNSSRRSSTRIDRSPQSQVGAV